VFLFSYHKIWIGYCSKSNVQKIYKRWGLSKFKKSIKIRGVVSQPYPKNEKIIKKNTLKKSAKKKFPDLVKNSNLKVNHSFTRLIKCSSYKKVSISNPGAIIIAPFLDQLGIVEALRTYGPESFSFTDITNSIIVNILRIVACFPSIYNFSTNSDRSVAIASGLSLNPKKVDFTIRLISYDLTIYKIYEMMHHVEQKNLEFLMVKKLL